MPQFDPSVFIPQLVWLAVFFAILYFGIVKLTLPRVDRVMDEREALVTGDLDRAEQSKREADSVQQSFEASMAEAQGNARVRLDRAREEANAKVQAQLAAATASLDEKQAAAEAELEESRSRALAEINQAAQELTSDVVERLIGHRPAPRDVQAALDHVAADR